MEETMRQGKTIGFVGEMSVKISLAIETERRRDWRVCLPVLERRARHVLFAWCVFAMLGAGSAHAADPTTAELMRRAQAGDASAQTKIGDFFENGHGGLPKDERQALAWYQKAADQGHAPAQ